MKTAPLLFDQQFLTDVLDTWLQESCNQAEALNKELLLTHSVTDLVSSCIDRHTVNSPEIHESKIKLSWDDDSFYFHIPYTGDSFVFILKLDSVPVTQPQGTVKDHEIMITISRSCIGSKSDANSQAEEIKQRFRVQLDRIKTHLEIAKNITIKFNNNIREAVSDKIINKHAKVIADENTTKRIVENIGYPTL